MFEAYNINVCLVEWEVIQWSIKKSEVMISSYRFIMQYF